MKRILLLFSFYSFILCTQAQTVNVMLVTGGHEFDTVQFLEMFDAMEEVEYQHFEQPVANKVIANSLAENFDVLVFYDMWQDISAMEKSGYLDLTKKGIPFLFIHHSLVSYQNWKVFEEIIGGKYIEKGKDIPDSELSTFEHDVWVYIQKERNHPAMNGFGSFRFFDEVYDNIRVSDKVTPLLSTTHPKSNRIIAWENYYNSSKIIYLQPGHDQRTFNTTEYRKLIQQSIHYLAKAK